MAELKTKVNEASVTEFLDGVADEAKRKDSRVILEMMRQVAGVEPKMWGASIVGFGSHHYVGKSTEGDWPPLAFSPRKQALTLYLMGSWQSHAELLAKLGKYSLGKGCLYIKRLQDVNLQILKRLLEVALSDAVALAQATAVKQPEGGA